MTICILGRQPEIGLAELEALYGSERVQKLGASCALVDGDVDFSRLGGSTKCADVISTIPIISRAAVFKHIAARIPELVTMLPADGKIKLGISAYGLTISPYDLRGEGLRLKKVIRAMNRSVRVVPNETAALSSAQTFHNSLASELGLEFVVVSDGSRTVIGRVTHVQNIDAYRIRDRERPKRDAFVGMLPPKLAQTIVNLAVGSTEKPLTVLDPFCGTGVVLQEALLMGYSAHGTDINKKMVDYSTANLAWLRDKLSVSGQTVLEVADATKATWKLLKNTVVACEGYLGQPLGGQQPRTEKLQQIIHDSNTIMRGFLKNIGPQLSPSSRLCVAMPAWYIKDSLHHLPVIDELESFGFMRHTFQYAPDGLLYRREDQVTGRELIVLLKR